jgi:hypothetical protein
MHTAKDYDQALLTPESVFDTPMEIVASESLTSLQKMKVLKRWEANSHDLDVAQDESMTGGERSCLSEVRQAIHALERRADIQENNVS